MVEYPEVPFSRKWSCCMRFVMLLYHPTDIHRACQNIDDISHRATSITHSSISGYEWKRTSVKVHTFLIYMDLARRLDHQDMQHKEVCNAAADNY